jgi:hypothetical protein
MKWIDGETWKHKKTRLGEWHHWIAWYPVKIGVKNGHHVKIWLETIERRGKYYSYFDGTFWDWEYRERESQ